MALNDIWCNLRRISQGVVGDRVRSSPAAQD